MSHIFEVSEVAIIMCQGNVNIRLMTKRYWKCNEEDEMNPDTVAFSLIGSTSDMKLTTVRKTVFPKVSEKL